MKVYCLMARRLDDSRAMLKIFGSLAGSQYYMDKLLEEYVDDSWVREIYYLEEVVVEE